MRRTIAASFADRPPTPGSSESSQTVVGQKGPTSRRQVPSRHSKTTRRLPTTKKRAPRYPKDRFNDCSIYAAVSNGLSSFVMGPRGVRDNGCVSDTRE